MNTENTQDNATNHNQNKGFGQNSHHRGFYRGGPNMNWATSPGFHPGKLAAVVISTAIFPPLGLAALAYFLWNSRSHYYNSQGGPAAAGGHCGRSHHMRHRGFGMMRPTGNAAMDEHSEKVLNDLAETRRAFWDYKTAEKAKRDAQAFADFQSKAKETPPTKSDDAS